MNPEPHLSMPIAADAEPQAGRTAVPVWLIVLLFMILYLGMVYFDRNGGWFNEQVYEPYHSFQDLETWQPVTGEAGLAQQGKLVYNKPTCVACHQADGKGTPGQFPSLVQSEWVLEPEPGRIIRAVLYGLGGPFELKGQNFNGSMVPWKDALTDEEIAAVLTYVRQNLEWGNKAPEVKPERVKAVREKTKGRNQPYTQEELLKVSPAD